MEGWDLGRPDLYSGNWLDKMHRMIDALADGKTAEEYIATL